MNSVDRQIIYKISTKKVPEITIVFEDDWDLEINRKWGWKSEADRRLFKIKSEEGYEWFECSDDMGKEIRTFITSHISPTVDEVSILLNPVRIKPQEEKVSRREFLTTWQKFKKFIMGK
jgi:hypothetical protein